MRQHQKFFLEIWYLTAYTGIIICKPCLDDFVNHLTKSKAVIYSVVLLGILLYNTILGNLKGILFDLDYGYSFVWLAMLYIVGAIIKKFELHNKIKDVRAVFGVYFAMVTLTWIFKIAATEINGFGVFQYINLCSYVSPTIVVCAVCLLLLFSKINCGERIGKIIVYFSKASFGVYLIHAQSILYNQILDMKFAGVAQLSAVVIPFVVIGISMVIMVSCLFIDRIRIYMFSILKVNFMAQKIDEFGREKINKVVNYVRYKIEML